MRENFPSVEEGTSLRTVEQGVLEATGENGSALWYNSAFYEEPDAPHSMVQAANGVDWYRMEPAAQAPDFEVGEQALAYNQASFQNFMPGFEQQVTTVDGSHRRRATSRSAIPTAPAPSSSTPPGTPPHGETTRFTKTPKDNNGTPSTESPRWNASLCIWMARPSTRRVS